MSKKRLDLLRFSWVRSSIVIGLLVVLVCGISLFLFKWFDLGTTSWSLNMKSFIVRYGLAGILVATFLAGTLIPLGSPALVAAVAFYGMSKILLVLVATAGFTLGMMTNYGLARYLGRPYVLKRIGTKKLEDISNLWDSWGWLLYTGFGLTPVLPVELLALVCGLLKKRLETFFALTFLPRLILFTVLVYLGEQAGMWIGVL